MTRSRIRFRQLIAAFASLCALHAIWPSIHAFVVAIDHGDVFFADFAHHYDPTVRQSLRHGAPAGGFFYPASFAAMIAPIALFEPRAAKFIWLTVEVLALSYVAIELCYAASNRQGWLAILGTALTVTSTPVLHNMKWGQVSLPIVALVGAAFVRYERGNRTMPAILLSISAGIKGYPIVFFSWFFIRGDFRFVARGSLASVLVLLVLPALVMGPAHALFFQRISTGAVMGAADGVLRDFNSQYAPAVLARFFGGWDSASARLRTIGQMGCVVALCAITMLLILVARSHARAIASRREGIAVMLIAGSVPFWLRTSWPHYFVHLPVAQVLAAGMVAETFKRPDKRITAIFVSLFLLGPSLYLSNVSALLASDGWWDYANSGQIFFANFFVLLALSVLLIEAHIEHTWQKHVDLTS